MGNRYNHHLHHHQNLHNNTTYLPILCSRPSIKDVHLSRWHDRSTTSSSASSTSSSKDPSSPRVSCVGQVKIRNNKTTIIAYATPTRPTTTTTTTTTKDNHNLTPYSKLKRLFSTKNLSTTATTTTRTSSTGVSCRREMMIMGSPRRRSKCRDETRTNNYERRTNNYVHPVVDVAEMDPPLPVIKKVQQPGEGRDEVNLWKRRSAAHGVALKSLKIQQIHIPNNHFLQPTTV
ncbi:uncharacterized protein LOC132273266 [Cornus florida]|uniref:uncharacterized protein LOC132273266 n=1 Tax=Cornus florida TaxID=4283 RepID=UPI00289726F6|nr:uncharacterized protein LOC132273266 [Cornus florida]